MTAWTADELTRIGQTDELNLQSLRGDGSLRDPVTIWVVRHGDDLYVRPVRGRAGWYRGIRSQHQAHVSSGGVDKDVALVESDADEGLNDGIDTAYRVKYRSYPDSFVDAVTNPKSRSATLKLVPR